MPKSAKMALLGQKVAKWRLFPLRHRRSPWVGCADPFFRPKGRKNSLRRLMVVKLAFFREKCEKAFKALPILCFAQNRHFVPRRPGCTLVATIEGLTSIDFDRLTGYNFELYPKIKSKSRSGPRPAATANLRHSPSVFGLTGYVAGRALAASDVTGCQENLNFYEKFKIKISSRIICSHS